MSEGTRRQKHDVRSATGLVAAVTVALGMLVSAGSADAATSAKTRVGPSCAATSKKVSTVTKKAVKAACLRRAPKKLRRSVVHPLPAFARVADDDPRIVHSTVATPAVATPVTSGSNTAPTTRQPVSPVLECVSEVVGSPGLYRAHFGYSNKNDSRVPIALGGSNKFVPGGDVGQPTLFNSGRLVDAFQVTFNGSNLVWALDGRTATASSGSKRCAVAPTEPTFFPDQVAVVALDDTAAGPEYTSLRTIGVPAVLSSSIADAVRYKMIVVAGTLAPGAVSAADAALLERHVNDGGVLIGESVSDPALTKLFGVGDDGALSTARTRMDWTTDPTTAELDQPSERQVSLDDVNGSVIPTFGYSPSRCEAQILATFNDGAAAVTRNTRGKGAAYVVGGRLVEFITRHHEGARWPRNAKYENNFDTTTDGWLLWLRGVYRTHIGGGVTMSTAPGGAKSAVIPTLSLNFAVGTQPAVEYVERAKAAGATPTVFVNTKIVEDYLDTAFFSDSGTFDASMQKIRGMGAEIASHSVSHSPIFHKLPLGTGTETFGTYLPRVESKTVTTGATMLGEIRVSRQLLEPRLNGRMTSFRAGYLLASRQLAIAEEATGIRDDSSTTQGWVGGAFPFSIPRLDGKGYADVTTFPIVVEDERGARFDQRIGESLDIMAKNADNGAPSVILVHPNGWEWKQQAWTKLLTGLPTNAWRGTLQQFGDFWQDRQRSALETAPSMVCAGGRFVRLRSLNAAWPVRSQALDVSDRALTRLVLADGSQRVVNADRKVTLPDVPGGGAITGNLCP